MSLQKSMAQYEPFIEIKEMQIKDDKHERTKG